MRLGIATPRHPSSDVAVRLTDIPIGRWVHKPTCWPTQRHTPYPTEIQLRHGCVWKWGMAILMKNVLINWGNNLGIFGVPFFGKTPCVCAVKKYAVSPFGVFLAIHVPYHPWCIFPAADSIPVFDVLRSFDLGVPSVLEIITISPNHKRGNQLSNLSPTIKTTIINHHPVKTITNYLIHKDKTVNNQLVFIDHANVLVLVLWGWTLVSWTNSVGT